MLINIVDFLHRQQY